MSVTKWVAKMNELMKIERDEDIAQSLQALDEVHILASVKRKFVIMAW